MNRSVLITGAAGGLGAATAEEFAGHGWDVFAADLVAPAPNSRQIPIALDVTDNASCEAAARDITRHTDRLSAVVNFAGILDLGPLMEVSEERLRRSWTSTCSERTASTSRCSRSFRPEAAGSSTSARRQAGSARA